MPAGAQYLDDAARADPGPGAYRIVAGPVTVTNVDDADLELSGSTACDLANLSIGFVKGLFVDFITDELEAHIDDVGRPLCAAPAPVNLGPCA